jgi:type IX secretion system PorP/SprF family membrane protein
MVHTEDTPIPACVTFRHFMGLTRALIVLIALHPLVVRAQDIHFTQFTQAPLIFSSASAGIHEGAGIIYRSQWGSIDEPYVTASAFGQTFLKRGFDKVGIGLSLLRDVAGPGEMSSFQAWLSADYQLSLGRHALVVGVQPGIVRRNVHPVSYPNQYDPAIGGFNTTLPNGEALQPDAVSYFDLNAGLGLALELGLSRIFISQSFQHVIKPNYSLMSGSATMPLRSTSWLGADIPLSEVLGIQPALLWSRHQGATEVNLQSRFYYEFGSDSPEPVRAIGGIGFRNNTTGVHGAGVVRSSDAAFVITGFTLLDAEFSLSYDFNVSGLRQASHYRGAFELAIIWKNITRVVCGEIVPPCIRI